MGSDFADTSSQLSTWTCPSAGADGVPAWFYMVFTAAGISQETTLRGKKIKGMEKTIFKIKAIPKLFALAGNS